METKIKVLLVEDNAADVRLIQESLAEGDLGVELHAVEDGLEAMNFLLKRGKYAKVFEPDMILLDLTLPIMDGRELLAKIKSNAGLRQIPVVVLTSSEAKADIENCYNLRANCYTNKPIDAERFATIVRTLEDFNCVEDFWFTIMQDPVCTTQ
jgi:chemotaxis family two-component system response regulator Rcp1